MPSWLKLCRNSRTMNFSSGACLALDSTDKQNFYGWVVMLRSTYGRQDGFTFKARAPST